MRMAGWITSIFCIAFSINSSAETSDSMLGQLQSQRQIFSQDSKVDLQKLSLEIQATVKESVALDQAGNATEALNRLLVLQKYAPLAQFPSYDVQTLCARLYGKMANENDAAACRRRAAALAEILQKRSGSGATPDDPVQVIMIGEVGEWVHSISAEVSDVRAYPYHDTDLQAISYTAPTTAGKSTVAYFSFTPRLRAEIKNTKIDVFKPLPIRSGDGKYGIALEQAHEQRVKFLADTSFNYPELIMLCDNLERESIQLEQQGDISGALSKIKEVEKIRPIREIPTYYLISTYSFLLGKAGDVNGQSDMKMYLFGITQDIAHSGDGLTPESAVHVIAISEEYGWLHAKNLRMTGQKLLKIGDRRYDEIDATDGNGNPGSFFFEVSQVYIRQSPVPVQ